MDFLELSKKRYSVRKFKELPIPQVLIDKILMAGRAAPTAHNYQPQKIIVVNSPKGLRTLKKCTECHYNAPLAFIICYDREKCWKRSYDGKSSGDIDASIVASLMMMEATELGIGSTWIMYFIPEAVKVEFGLSDNTEPVAVLLMGYADEKPSQEHFNRCNLEDYVTYR